MGAAEEARLVKRAILFGFIPLLLYGAGAGKLFLNNLEEHKALALKRGKIQHFYDNGFNVPDQAKIDKQLEEIRVAQEKVNGIISSTTHSPVLVPPDVSEAGVYFKERLYLTQRDLKNLASTKGVSLPGNIGFGEELPEENEVPGLLLKLELADKLLRILIENHVFAVHKIEFLEKRGLEAAPVAVISVAIQASAAPEALKTSLYEIGNLSPSVVLERLKIVEAKSEQLDLNLQASVLVQEEQGGKD